jgi:hypothetical protein
MHPAPKSRDDANATMPSPRAPEPARTAVRHTHDGERSSAREPADVETTTGSKRPSARSGALESGLRPAPSEALAQSDETSWTRRLAQAFDDVPAQDEALVRAVLLLIASEWVEGPAAASDLLAGRLRALGAPSEPPRFR